MILLPLSFLLGSLIQTKLVISIPNASAADFQTATSAIPLLRDFYAEQYGVSTTTMDSIIQCESGYDPKAVGDKGKSHGLVQIYSPAHPTITIEQAESPFFALDFLAKNLSKGRGKMWSCYPHK